MSVLSQKHFNFNYKHFLIDEIALDGLEGIGIDLLWRRMEYRIGSQITPKMKVKYFKFIAECESVLLYQLNEPPPHIEIVDRFTMIDETTGHLLDPPDYLDGPYEYHVVPNEYGSCPNYDTRLLIPKNAVQMMSYEEVMSQFGEKLVLVASLEERWQALASHLPITYLNQLSPTHYCILELIGKSRENGQMTIGKTNLNKIVKEPKLLFYNRNTLQKLDLIKNQYATQVTSGKAMKSIILRLKRYNLSKLETLPKIGRIHDMVQYLLKQPDRSEQNEILIKKGYMTSRQSKRLQKGINIFRFEEREIKLEKSISKTEKQKMVVKKKFVSLTTQSDESSQSEEETEEPIKCQYKVGINLMRQAYERLLDAGIRGLTQVEVAQLLGIEFYTSRTICRILKGKKIVREFMEDKGRQRTARYIAIAATKEKDKEYANEKNKLLEYVNKKSRESNNFPTEPNTAIDNDTDYEVPLKKIKLENEASVKENLMDIDDDTVITEIKVLDGFENVKETLLNSKKSPTLRQLKFANGILKVVNSLKYVIGFQTLSTLVSKEINEPAMDTKALKLFVQKLVTDEQLKILRLKRPKNYNKYTFFICAPNIKATDAIIINKYKEIFARSQLNKKSKKTVTTDVTRPQAHFVYPRYMKIQKLHEFIMQLIYFNVNDSDPSYPVGFGSLFYIIPEMTIEFALGNITNIDTDVAQLKLNDSMYGTKIRDAPDYLGRILLQSKSLHNSVRVGLRVLAVLGLVQLINQPSTIMTKDGGLVTYVFYVNRYAKILDTTGKWPREEVDLKKIEKSYYFESMNDVGNYWTDVYTISLNTTVNLPKRERYRLVHPMRDENSVTEYDTGVRYGDGYGPCGFDSSMFMDIPRLWRTFLQRTNNTQTVAVKSKLKPKKRIKKIKTIKSDIIKVKKKRVTKDKENGEIKTVKPPRIRKKPSDYQVQWSEFEDKIIMMCKVAIMIMSPVSQPGCLKIRNTVAKDLLTMFDPKKTASNCHKRAVTQELNSMFLHEKVCILNELRRRKDAIKKYEGLLKVLRIRHHANITRFVNEARLPMLELMWIINQIEKNKSYVQRIPCIAMNLEAFNLSYTITASSTNRPYNTYKTPTSEPELAVLKEAIILTTMLSLKSLITSETAKKIYSLYKAYNEPTLRSAIEHLRKSGAIAARDKIINNHFNSANFEYIVQSSYKIASVYQRKWVQRLDGEFGENLEELLNTDIPKNGLKGCSELNCLLCEMCCSDVLEIVSDTIPVVTGSGGSILQEEQMNVIDMENRFKLKSGLIGWKSKSNVEKFSSVYEKVNTESILATLVKNAVVESFTNEDLDMDNEVIVYLENKGETGCTYKELQKSVSLDREGLCDMLKDLEEKSIIKRVGVYENRILLTKFAKPYFLNIKPDLNIIPTPWLNLDTEIQLDIFLKWASVIMNKVFETPGCSVTYLSNHYEFITIRSVQDICVFLEKSKCVTMQCVEKKEIDLFSDDDGVVELYEFNPFDSPDSMLVFPVKNCITRFVHVKKCMINTLDSSE